MAALKIVVESPECEPRLRARLAELDGAVQHVIRYQHTDELQVAVGDDRLLELVKWMRTSGGFRWQI